MKKYHKKKVMSVVVFSHVEEIDFEKNELSMRDIGSGKKHKLSENTVKKLWILKGISRFHSEIDFPLISFNFQKIPPSRRRVAVGPGRVLWLL